MRDLNSYSIDMTEYELRSWLMRHQSTFDFFESYHEGGYYSWSFFTMRYSLFLDLIRFVEHITKPSFLEEIFEEKDNSEETLIKKILSIEKTLLKHNHTYLIWVWKNEEQYNFYTNTAFIRGGIFDQFAKLWAWFKPRHLDLLKKYFALTPLETEEFCTELKHESSTDTIHTLSFHLDVRKKARSNGEYIPMGLWSEDQPIPFWKDDVDETKKA
ncbi:hypothetical protein [Algoriphagus limi]|uniref:Uncharacterized protein n=1 Tax=Algoriphagus limi TaxID=2975273 RepID=A0ABT2G0T8_9BACT|nr:hypothetical protein [Algoriphagus limi]MCS5488869.1 hypothetical protein [Algoriphagus limi]